MAIDYSKLRKPMVNDAPGIAGLINCFSEKGLLLPRPVNDVYEHLRDFVVLEREGILIGCAALHVVWNGLGEIRSLAVAEEARNSGVGRSLVEFCLHEARELDIQQIFVLTRETRFFEKFGFRKYPKEDLPQKIWKDCIHCPKFPTCDEVSMLLDLQDKTQ